MKERPIIFSGPMVRAILDGYKTQTRRVIKFDLVNRFDPPRGPDDVAGGYPFVQDQYGDFHSAAELCPFGKPGERLWVRETWCYHAAAKTPWVGYRADGDFRDLDYRWRPSIHMPRWASRINLEITAVRVERLQDISLVDVDAEGIRKPPCIGLSACGGGCDACEAGWAGASLPALFSKLWDSINGERPGCTWADNPWVWAIAFRRVEHGEDKAGL